jgi:poly-beta-1,6-N-acetyl-D-glucosamine synthase
VPHVSLLPVLISVLVIGVNFSLWGVVGAARAIDGRVTRRKDPIRTRRNRPPVNKETWRGNLDWRPIRPRHPTLRPGVRRWVGKKVAAPVRWEHNCLCSPTTPCRRTCWCPPAVPDVLEVGAILPAHNEGAVIERTLIALARILPTRNIHVVSDGSTDDTANLAREFGAHVLELAPGRGKASALAEGISHFGLLYRFRVVLILDADSRLDKDYLHRGLPYFADDSVVAVAGYATTDWPGRELSWWGRFLIAHRERIYVLSQYLQKYGQTWKPTNVTFIIPGYASMYRTRALARIDISAPGLIIEDFNMTFEVHRKRLGRVAFHPDVIGYTQDPNNLRDYVRQVKRWQLGFWQTLRRHGLWVSGFTASLALMVLELVAASLMLVLLPIALLLAVLHNSAPGVPTMLDGVATWASGVFDPLHVLLFIFVPDYALSCIVAAVQRRPSYLLFGLAFLPMRVVDAAIVIWAIPAMAFKKSSGKWVSPTRRP